MNNILGDLVCSVRSTVSQGFRSLPVLLAGSILVLGLAQGNINLMFFFVGMFILTPFATVLFNLINDYLFKIWPFTMIDSLFWKSPNANAEQCTLFATPEKDKEFGMPIAGCVVPSYWMTIMAFFFSYLYANASELYNKPVQKHSPEQLVTARQSQAMISMLIITVTAILFTLFRYATSCETALGIFVSWLVGFLLATGWYAFMRSCGLGRLDDIFGINNQLLPHQSYEDEAPKICVPMV